MDGWEKLYYNLSKDYVELLQLTTKYKRALKEIAREDGTPDAYIAQEALKGEED